MPRADQTDTGLENKLAWLPLKSQQAPHRPGPHGPHSLQSLGPQRGSRWVPDPLGNLFTQN